MYDPNKDVFLQVLGNFVLLITSGFFRVVCFVTGILIVISLFILFLN